MNKIEKIKILNTDNVYDDFINYKDETIFINSGIKQAKDLFKVPSLNIIAGDTGTGKTTFAVWLLRELTKNNKVLFFSLEMEKNLMYYKIKDIFKNNKEQLKNLNIIYETEINCLDIETYIKQCKAKIVIIDTFNLLNTKDNIYIKNDIEKDDFKSRRLKNMSKELDICIIAIAQLRKKLTNIKDLDLRIPQIEDIKGSSSIIQNANTVSILYRPEYYIKKFLDLITEKEKREIYLKKMEQLKNMIFLSIQKNRCGKINNIKFICNFIENNFIEQETDF